MLLAAEFDTLRAINEGRQASPAGPLFKKRRRPSLPGSAAGIGREKRAPAAAPSYAEPEWSDTGLVSVREIDAAEITEKRGFL